MTVAFTISSPIPSVHGRSLPFSDISFPLESVLSGIDIYFLHDIVFFCDLSVWLNDCGMSYVIVINYHFIYSSYCLGVVSQRLSHVTSIALVLALDSGLSLGFESYSYA